MSSLYASFGVELGKLPPDCFQGVVCIPGFRLTFRGRCALREVGGCKAFAGLFRFSVTDLRVVTRRNGFPKVMALDSVTVVMYGALDKRVIEPATVLLPVPGSPLRLPDTSEILEVMQGYQQFKFPVEAYDELEAAVLRFKQDVADEEAEARAVDEEPPLNPYT